MISKEQAYKNLLDMQKSLKEWLYYRSLLSLGADGRLPGGDRQKASNFIAAGLPEEATLARKLKELLLEANYEGNVPEDAESLAKIVLSLSTEQKAASGLGIWPIVIVGAVIAVVLTIRSVADYAKEKRRIQCIEAGYCSDASSWWKWGLIAVAGYFIVTKTEVGGWLGKAYNKAEAAWPHVKAIGRQASKRG